MLGLVVLMCCAGVSGPRVSSLPPDPRLADADVLGTVVLLDPETQTLTLLDLAGTRQGQTGGAGWDAGRFDSPSAVWARNGIDVFVADRNNHRIQRFDRSLNFVAELSTRDDPDPSRRFGYPADMALSRQGDLYVCDTENGRIVQFASFNRVERIFGGIGSGRGLLRRPSAVEVGPGDRVFVQDDGRIVIFDAFGSFISELVISTSEPVRAMLVSEHGAILLGDSSLAAFDANLRLREWRALDDPQWKSALAVGLAREKMFFWDGSSLRWGDSPLHEGESDRPGER